MSLILDQLRACIEASGKSRYELSKETNIAQSQLSRLMNKKAGVRFETLERLAEALDLEIIIRPRQARWTSKR